MRDERRTNLLDAVGERELELGDQELLDVWTANIVGLLNLDDAEDLKLLAARNTASRGQLNPREST